MTLAYWAAAPGLAVLGQGAAAQSPGVYYICPGNVFTNTLSAKEAESRGCKAREAREPTIIAGPSPTRPRPPVAPNEARPGDNSRIGAAEQRSRDSDARRILEAELRKEEQALDALRREFNNGQPERRGDERNGQKYQERIDDMKAAIQRKEEDLAAIRRELSKLPS